MSRGKNLAESGSLFSMNSDDICIFLSHISIDKAYTIAIAEYILDAGYNVYLDIKDQALQNAVVNGDSQKITDCIEKGITNCSHLLCLISNETSKSWWVPYEIGYGKKSKKNIATLTIKDTTDIPDYLKITQLLRGTKSLNQYLVGLKSTGMYKYSSTNVEIINESTCQHPLDNYLNWDK